MDSVTEAHSALISYEDFLTRRPVVVEGNRIAVKANLKKRIANAKTKADIKAVIAIAEKNIAGINRMKDNKINTGNIVPVVDKKLKEGIINKTLRDMEDIIEMAKDKELD